MVIQVPLGFHFRPSDGELITYFLDKKEKGLPLSCDRVIEKEIYGGAATPWNVFGKDDQPYWNDCDDPNKKMIFVFSKLSKVGNSNKKICRVAGCGTWEGKSLSQSVKNSEGRIIGKKRAFTFKPRKGLESEAKGKGHWIMHEMSVDRYNYVVCRITRDMSKESLKHEEQKEEEAVVVSAVGKGLNCYDDEEDDQRESCCRKRKSADQSDEGEEESRKKLCSRDGVDTATDQQTRDTIDMSFLFEDDDHQVEIDTQFCLDAERFLFDNDEDGGEEEIYTSFCGDAERFSTYVQEFGSCIC